MAMNSNEIKNTARNFTVDLLKEVFEANDAVQFADASWAILHLIDGQEIWTEVTVKSKAYKPTKISPAFDPYEAAEAWREEKKIKAEEKAAKDAEKAKKVAAAKAKREEAE